MHHMETLINKLMGSRPFWLTMVLWVGFSTLAVASKGGGESKEKKGYVLKVNGFEVKKDYLSPISLMRQGATYRGMRTPMQQQGSSTTGQSMMSFQKGNTIYLYPVQPQSFFHKLKVPSKVSQ